MIETIRLICQKFADLIASVIELVSLIKSLFNKKKAVEDVKKESEDSID